MRKLAHLYHPIVLYKILKVGRVTPLRPLWPNFAFLR